MGFLETEERESLEIKSLRYEVDTSQSDRFQGERAPSPTSSENPAFLNNNFQNNFQNLTNSFIKYSTPRKLSASFSMRNASASLSLSYLMIIIGVITIMTIILVGMIMDSFYYHQRDFKGCKVPSMYPSYIKQDNFDSEQTRFAGKYGLYLYRDQEHDSNNQPIGIPALFIPGNAGSFKQVRSIASETSVIFSKIVLRDQKLLEMGVRALDFFTVDFNEEFSALHGHSLNEQAEYLNDAIRYILSLYPSTRKTQNTNSPHPYPDPTSVIIIGHSMGGIVARTLFTMPNYQPGSINTILTFATPHVLPPAPFDWQISKIYTDINEFWRNGYAASENSLADVTLISIAGGNLDTIVCSDSANINSIVPASHGFTVFTTSIPNVWTSMDHQAILWCEQLVKVVAASLLSVVDIRRSGQTKTTAERMMAFRKFYLTGLEDPIDLVLNKSKREFFGIVNLEKVPHKFLNMGQRIVLNRLNLTSQVYLMPIPPAEPLSTFSLLTDQYLSKNPGVEILLCDVMQTEVPEHQNKDDDLSLNIDLPTAPRLSCHIASNEASLLPASRSDLKHPFSGLTFNYLKLNVRDLGDYQYIAIMFNNKVFIEGFLIGEFFDERLTIMDLNNSSMKDLIFDGIHVDGFPEHQAMVSYLHVPIIDSSLMTYKMSVRRTGCVEQHFAPFVRQSISSMYESKFLVNIEDADLNIHGQSPFVAPVSAPKGLELQFWVDPTCSVPLSIDIECDFYGSLGKMVIRFQTVLVAFPFIIVIMTLRTQFIEYDRGEPFMNFGHGLALFIRRTFLKFIIFVTALSVYQSITRASKAYSLADLFPMDNASGDMQKAKSSFNVNDTLLGNQDPFFWFLPPLFFIMSIGMTIICWILLASIVNALAVAVFIIRRKKHIAYRPSESKSRLRRHIIITIILFILVASFVPYQFAFIVAFLVHILSCVKSLIVARSSGSMNLQESWDNYHYLQSMLLFFFMLLPFNIPVLMVWIRNMSVNWFAPFSWDHSLLAIAPIIFYVEIITNGKMLPRSTGRKSRFITNAMLLIITIYSLLYGVRYTYLLYFSSLGFITWLIILHVRDSWIGKAMDIYMQSIFKRNMKIS